MNSGLLLNAFSYVDDEYLRMAEGIQKSQQEEITTDESNRG